MEDIFDAFMLVLIWIANGGLVIVFWSIGHLLLLAAIPAFYLLVVQARQEQRGYALVAGGLALLASVLVPPPILLIILAMAWAGTRALILEHLRARGFDGVVSGATLHAIVPAFVNQYSR